MNAQFATRICAAILALYATILIVRTAPMQAWPGTGAEMRHSSDFVALWTAGRLAAEGRPLAAYDWNQQREEFAKVLGAPMTEYPPFPYPPVFLALMAVLSLLAFGTAHMVWVAATYAAYATAAARIMKSAQGVIWMSTPVALIYNADTGQTGALSAALLGLGLAFVPSRPVLAGIFFGALSYKPHLGLLIPIALAAAGYWRTFASAAATAIGLAVVATLAFGFEVWPAFVAQMANMAAHIHAAASPWKLQSCYGLLRSLGAGAHAALAMHGVFCVMIAAGVTLLWRRADVRYEHKAAALAAGAVLMSPYLFVYDLAVLMAAQAFLLSSSRDGQRDGQSDPWLVAAIVAANLCVLLSPAIGFPAGFAAPLIMLALVARRCRAEAVPDTAARLRSDLIGVPA